MLWAKEAWFIFLSILALAMGWSVGKRLPNALCVVPVAVAAGFALTLWIGMTQSVEVDHRADLKNVEFGWPVPWLSEGLEFLSSPPYPSRIQALDPSEADGAAVSVVALALDTAVNAAILFAGVGLADALAPGAAEPCQVIVRIVSANFRDPPCSTKAKRLRRE
jgi:hypothetical protein